MHIKQVVIEGFKSYKDQAITDPFSRNINVVVGANGSGKSNFFHAIRFVLNDAFTNMRAEERQQLLHEGAGHAVTSAYVEVVFDNSDGRFPIDREEIRLRRTIGLKKDEYQLDKKHVNKSEVTNLLESAGFSRANPYYIVQQGKITAMSQMKDAERMELLKEIGGTKVYEERRGESLKLMKETESRRTQIEEMVSNLEAKLKDLESERAELAQYQAADRTRRCLEFTLLDRDERAVRTEIDKVDEQHSKVREVAGAAQAGQHRTHSELASLAAELRAADSRKQALEAKRNDLQAQRQQLSGQRAAVEAELRDLEGRVARSATLAGSAEKELAALDAEVAQQQQQLQAVISDLSSLESQEASLRTALQEATARQQTLLQKQSRKAHFSSKDERDAHLESEARKLEAVLQQKEASLAATTQELRERNEQLMELAQCIGDRESEVRTAEEALAAAERQWSALRQRRDVEQNAKKDSWREEAELEAAAKVTEEELRRARSSLDQTIPMDVRRGLRDLEQVVKELGLSHQVHGQLLHLIECPPQMNLAVEVTAGNSLFNVVVDTDEVASRLISQLARNKMGRVTFMPLNRLRPPAVSYPSQWGDGVMPLTKRIKHDPRFSAAIEQVFSKSVVCRDMDLALQVQRLGTLSAVTLEGDVAAKRGTMTGGYHDESRARLETWRQIQALTKQVAEYSQKKRVLADEASRLDEVVAGLTGEVAKLEAQRTDGRNKLRSMKEEVRLMRREEQQTREQVEAEERASEALRSGIVGLQRQLSALRAEMGTDLLAQLNPADRQELTSLQPRLQSLSDQLSALAGRKAEVAARRAGVERRLNDHLLTRRTELADALQGEEVAADRVAVESRSSELTGLESALATMTSRVAEAEAAAEQAAQQARDLTARHNALREAQGQHGAHVAEEGKTLEALAAKRAALVARQEDMRRKVAELGALPAEAFTKYKDKGVKELKRLLTEALSELSKFGHVNRKALDQYSSFAEQRDEVARRIDDMKKSEAKIWELIQSLDMRKDEAIERTFKGVAKNFREVFADLVPGGRGELVMLKRHPGGGDAAEEDGGDDVRDEGGAKDGKTLEKYVGVKVKIAFTPGGETMSLKQLSGGQKTLVALALIFAIQRCDPAPFYLFDEIDAALDPQYRTTVAKMLRKQSNDPRNPAQFIVTTFHPQIVAEADHIYGVAHKNRISNVYVITQEDAMNFLQVVEDNDKQVGGAAADHDAAGRADGVDEQQDKSDDEMADA